LTFTVCEIQSQVPECNACGTDHSYSLPDPMHPLLHASSATMLPYVVTLKPIPCLSRSCQRPTATLTLQVAVWPQMWQSSNKYQSSISLRRGVMLSLSSTDGQSLLTLLVSGMLQPSKGCCDQCYCCGNCTVCCKRCGQSDVLAGSCNLLLGLC